MTQQPLKGKSNLERSKGWVRWKYGRCKAYGVVYLLNELLSAKCNDIITRHEIKHNFQETRPTYNSHQIEGMVVLVKELFSMCIRIEPTK